MKRADIGFIIGCARSGTTWLGRMLAHSPGFHVTVEHPRLFPLVDRMALNPTTVPALMPWLLSLYQAQAKEAAPRMYVDKSHQNIWLVEHLAQEFKNARFVGIERSAYGAIASMLYHQGVLAHFEQWRLYPVPNRHIGLPERLVDHYDDLRLVAKCALRWSAHHNRMGYLQARFKDRLLVLGYEELVQYPERVCRRLGDFLGTPVRLPRVDEAPLEKWKSVLSTEDIQTIDDVVAYVEMAWVQQC